MKYILLTFFTIFVTNSFANCKNKLPLSEVQKAINLEAGAGKFKCKDKPDEQCVCYDGINWHGAELVDRYADDYDKPIKEKQDIEACDGESNCQEKLSQKDCGMNEAYYDAEFTQVWCSVITGYEQKLDGKKLVNDQARIDAHNQAQVQKAQQAQAIAQAKKSMNCGKDVVALLMVRSAQKGLSVGQRKQILQNYSGIKELLDVGNLGQAKTEMQAATVDGTLVTEDDKAALIAKIDECSIAAP